MPCNVAALRENIVGIDVQPRQIRWLERNLATERIELPPPGPPQRSLQPVRQEDARRLRGARRVRRGLRVQRLHPHVVRGRLGLPEVVRGCPHADGRSARHLLPHRQQVAAISKPRTRFRCACLTPEASIAAMSRRRPRSMSWHTTCSGSLRKHSSQVSCRPLLRPSDSGHGGPSIVRAKPTIRTCSSSAVSKKANSTPRTSGGSPTLSSVLQGIRR